MRKSIKKRNINNNKHDVSQDSIDYTLSSSDDETDLKFATPALSKHSDAPTDITKVHVQELGGIAHEQDQFDVIETRSDLKSASA